MNLKRLTIRALESWESKGEGYTGEMTTVSPATEVSIRLTDDACRKILKIAAGGIVAAAQEQSAFLLQAATQLSTPLIGDSSND